MIDINELKAAAEKATPGPWVYPRDASGAPDLAIFSSVKPKSAHSEHGPVIAHVAMADPVTGFLPKGAYEANATFIALANPTAILSIIERVEALEDALSSAITAMETLGHPHNWGALKKARAALSPTNTQADE